MTFIITNGSSYCHRNKTRAVEIVDTIDQATKFPSKEAAERLLARATKKLAGYHIEETGTEQNRPAEKGKSKAAANSPQKRGRRRKADAADTQQAAAPDEAVITEAKAEETGRGKKIETAQAQENPEAEKNHAEIPDDTKTGGKTAASQGRKRRTRRKQGKDTSETASEKKSGRNTAETAPEKKSGRDAAETAPEKETGKEPAPAKVEKEAGNAPAPAAAEKGTDKETAPVTAGKEAASAPAPTAAEKETDKETAPVTAGKETDKETVPATAGNEADKAPAPAAPAGFNFKVTVHHVGSSKKKETSETSKTPEKKDAPAEAAVPAAPAAAPASAGASAPEKKPAQTEASQPQTPVIKPVFTVTTTTVGQKQSPVQSKKAAAPEPQELPAAVENVSASGTEAADKQPADSRETPDRRRKDRRTSADPAADRENSNASRQDNDVQGNGRSRRRRGNNRQNPVPAADIIPDQDQTPEELPYEDVFSSEPPEAIRRNNRSVIPARNNPENTAAANQAVQSGSGRSRRRNGSAGQRLAGARSTRNPAKAMANQTDLRRRFTQAERNLIYNRTEGHCGICGRFIPLEEYTIDHIVPLSKGGTNDLDNLQACCGFCNKAKDDSMGEEFFKRIEHIFLYQAKLKFGKKQAKRLKKTIRELEDEADEI